MEESESDSEAESVWRLLSSPLLALLRNLPHASDGLSALMTSIINSNRDFSEVLIPNQTSSEKEAHYAAFDKWLLGKLFYILSLEQFESIHQTSISAQMKILSILYINEAVFFNEICREYISTYNIIVNHCNDCDDRLEFGMFTSNTQIPYLDLDSIQIVVADSNGCKLLIKRMMDIFCQLLISTRDLQYSIDSDRILDVTMSVVENSDYDLKSSVVEFFTKLFDYFGLSSEWICTQRFFQTIENLISQMVVAKSESIAQYRQIDTLNDRLENFFTTVKRLGSCSNGDINIIILNTCKFIMSYDDKMTDGDRKYIRRVIFRPELKNCCSQLMNDLFNNHTVQIFNVDNIEEYIKEMPSFVVSKLMVEIIDYMHFAYYKRSNIDMNENSNTYRDVLALFKTKLENACDLNIDMFIMVVHLDTCLGIFNVLENFRIEFYNHHQAKLEVFENIFFTNNLTKATLVNMQKIPLLTFILHDVATVVIKSVVNILKIALSMYDKPLEVLLKCMELVMLLLTLTSDIKFDDLKTLLEIECFSLTSEMFSQYPSDLFSSNSHNKIHIHTLHILLMQNLCRVNLLNSGYFRKMITDFTLSLDTDNESNLIEILNSSPLLLINNILSPAMLIRNYIHPTLFSKSESLIETVISILPIVVCTLHGHYAIIQSKDERQPIDCEHKLSCLNGLHFSIVCLHCYDIIKSLPMQRRLRHDLSKNKIMILTAKSHLAYNVQYDSLKDLRSLFIEQFLDLKIYSNVHVSLVSKLVFAFARHSILTLESIESLISEKNLVHLLSIFRPFVTNVLNDDKLEPSLKKSILETSINVLLRTTKVSLETNDISLQDTCLEAIRQFGMGPFDKVILPAVKLLIYYVMHPSNPYGSKAAFYIKDICQYHKVSPNKVYHRYKKDLCRIMMHLTLYNYHIGHGFSVSILKIIRTFGFLGNKDFVSKDMHHALPYIIPSLAKSDKLKPILSEISSLVHCEPSDFMNERFPHIYTYIYLNENDESAQKCIGYIENVTKESLTSLIKQHSRVILTELLMQYSCNPDKVMKACKWMAKASIKPSSGSSGSSSSSVSPVSVVDYIQPKLLGVLAYFDNKLVHMKIALSVKRKTLESFPYLFDLMGAKHLTPLRFKILATLRTTLTLMNEYPELNVAAWAAFIRNMDPSVMGSLLTTVVISMLPLLPRAPEKVNELFEFLIVKNENLLSNHLSDLFFLEEADVSGGVKFVITGHVFKNLPDKFIGKVNWYLKYFYHDTAEMKVYALKYLHKLIKNHRKDLDSTIFKSKSVHHSIVNLLNKLTNGCRDSDSQTADWSARCLGQLGALQPSLIPKKPKFFPSSIPFAFSIRDLGFAKIALMGLARVFQYEKFTKDMDCYSLAIQEILSKYNISPDGENSNIWNNFSSAVLQILVPLLSSRYTLAFPFNPVQVYPIYGSDHSTTFSEWAFSWAGQMIPLVDDESTQDMLRMVHPALKKDLGTLMIFLPYILLHTIISNNDIAVIKNEIMTIIKLRSFGSEPSTKIKSTDLRIMRNVNFTPTITPLILEEGMHIKCCKMVYTLIDFLQRWLGEWCHIKRKCTEEESYLKVVNFVNSFCKLTIAQGNFLCGELERALMYLEMYMEQSPEKLQEQLGFLAEIYANLNESDAVSGILRIKRNEPTLSELILTHEVTGQLQDAATCYEMYAQQGDIDKERLQGMVGIYLGLDQPFTALQLLQGADDKDPWDEAMAAEPFWRLGMFEELDTLLKRPELADDDRWGMSVGHCLLSLRGGMREMFNDNLKSARNSIIRRLNEGMIETTADENIYSRTYDSAFNLHMIAEIENIEDIVYRIKSLKDKDAKCTAVVNELIEDWDLRFKLIESSTRTVEPVLRLRRILLEQSKELLFKTHPVTASIFDTQIGKLWMQSAKYARKTATFQQAYIYILNGEKYAPKELFIEKAKFYWLRGKQEPAFSTLKRGLEEHFSDMNNLQLSDRKLCAKAKLLIAKYNDETTNVDMEVNISHYKEAYDVYNQWEKSLVCLGEYHERMYDALPINEKKVFKGVKHRLDALKCYGHALRYGHTKLYQSMPRLLTIWLELEPLQADNINNQTISPAIFCKAVEEIMSRLPLYLIFTAFNQIISRICHPVKEVYDQLKAIIIKLILGFPQQSLWMMMCVIKSGYAKRRTLCMEILNDPQIKKISTMPKFISDFILLSEKLILLCNTNKDNNSVTQVSKLVPELPKLFKSNSFSEILMPHERFIKILLPINSSNKDGAFVHNPFSPSVYIAGIEEEFTLLVSLQKPKKVTLKGSDGIKYIIMLKPNDDMRKDFRLMEFNAVVNRCLEENSEARERRLYIRTYTVLPLNEACGIIQWIPNLLGLRPILMQIYKNKGIAVNVSRIKQFLCAKGDPLAKKREIFETKLLPMHPPVFGEWFRFTFPDPHSWYQARSAYIHTTAVMSMVGYILGLGDRHGENILFDSTTGDTVHVDFNCLFNKGEKLEWAEKVPFRLTHNMRAAMGPLDYEGTYRKCCEITMRVLRAQTTTLMSVIRPFVYDPLVKWNRLPPQSKKIDDNKVEMTNTSAVEDLIDIEQRLRGSIRTQEKQLALSLSPEGQTNNLIMDAVNVLNLCQMYIGWGAFL